MRNVTFHKEKAVALITRALQAYQDRTHLFSRVHVDDASAPQHMHRPEGLALDSREYHLFLFFTTLLTYRSRSDVWFRQSVELYNLHPEFYSETVLTIERARIERALQLVGFIHPTDGSKRWYGTAGTLFSSHFEGDPLNFFSHPSVDSFLRQKEALKKQNGGIERLPGIAHKIYSLMAILFEEIGAIPSLPHGAIPVDLHLSRIMIAHGAVTGSGIVDAQRVAEFLRKPIADICEEQDISLFDAAHALWFIGSQLCKRCSQLAGIEMLCPLVAACEGSPNTQMRQAKGKWDLDAPRNRKGKRSPQQSFPGFWKSDHYLDLANIKK